MRRTSLSMSSSATKTVHAVFGKNVCHYRRVGQEMKLSPALLETLLAPLSAACCELEGSESACTAEDADWAVRCLAPLWPDDAISFIATGDAVVFFLLSRNIACSSMSSAKVMRRATVFDARWQSGRESAGLSPMYGFTCNNI